MNDFLTRQLVNLLTEAMREAAAEGAMRAIQSYQQAIEAMPPKLLLSPKDVGKQLTLGERKVSELFASGELPSFKLDGSRRVRAEDLQAFIARHFYAQNRDLEAEASQPRQRNAS